MRQRTIKIRVSEEELEALRARAQTNGLTLSELLRVAASGAPVPTKRQDQTNAHLLAQILGQMSRIGSNLNQIARAVNTGRIALPVERINQSLVEVDHLRLVIRRQLE